MPIYEFQCEQCGARFEELVGRRGRPRPMLRVRLGGDPARLPILDLTAGATAPRGRGA